MLLQVSRMGLNRSHQRIKLLYYILCKPHYSLRENEQVQKVMKVQHEQIYNCYLMNCLNAKCRIPPHGHLGSSVRKVEYFTQLEKDYRKLPNCSEILPHVSAEPSRMSGKQRDKNQHVHLKSLFDRTSRCFCPWGNHPTFARHHQGIIPSKETTSLGDKLELLKWLYRIHCTWINPPASQAIGTA